MTENGYEEILYKIISKEQILEHLLPLVCYLLTAYTINKLKFSRKFKIILIAISLLSQAVLWSEWRLRDLHANENFFQDLQLKRNFDSLDLKRKTKEVFKKYHPDVHSDNKEKYALIFGQKKSIIDLLSNPLKRELYDKFNMNLMNSTKDNDLLQENHKKKTQYEAAEVASNNFICFFASMLASLARPSQVQNFIKISTIKLVVDIYSTMVKKSTQPDVFDSILPHTPLFARKVIFQYLYGALISMLIYLALGKEVEQKMEIPKGKIMKFRSKYEKILKNGKKGVKEQFSKLEEYLRRIGYSDFSLKKNE